MARRRYLSTTVSTDVAVAKLAREHGEFAALLYTWMIPHADDAGSLPGDPEELLMLVVPGLRHRTAEDVQQALAGMVSLGLLEPRDEGRLYFPSSFFRHQTYITEGRRKAAQPHPAESHSETAAQISADQRVSPQTSASFKSSLKVSSSSPSGDVAAGAAVRAQVDEVWAYFKAKIQPGARLVPRDKIKARLRTFTVEDLMLGIDHFAADHWQMEHNGARGGAWFFHDDARSESYRLLEPNKGRENGHTRTMLLPPRPGGDVVMLRPEDD